MTAMVEVEAVINSRPLTYVSMEDIEEPLTPSHLLTGRRILSLPYHLCHRSEEDVEVGPEFLTKRARYLNRTLDRFWTRWRKEYLLELREAHRYHRGSTNPTQVSVGDVVVVHSADQPRAFWKLGQIKEVLPGRDGEIRGAVVRVASKGRQASTLHRPVSLLYPIEMSLRSQDSFIAYGEGTTIPSTSIDPQSSPQDDQRQDVEVPGTLRRSKRAAAFKARDQLLALALDD